jgi:hypothetical protein
VRIVAAAGSHLEVLQASLGDAEDRGARLLAGWPLVMMNDLAEHVRRAVIVTISTGQPDVP